MHKSPGYYAELKRAIPKDYILYISIFITFLKWHDYKWENK